MRKKANTIANSPSTSSSGRGKTKAQRVFLDLRSRILAGQFPPETRLTLRPLAKEYGTGINAVSDAVKALAAEGLVELEGQAGARVIPRDLERIRGEYILRMVIECETARRCAELADETQMCILENMAAKVDRLFEEGHQLSECRNADIQFHLTIATFSGVPVLRDALAPLLDRLVALDQTEKRTLEIPGQKHQEVYEGLKTRDPAIASDVMQKHLQHSMNLSLALLF
jgi:DNA-binding GntR family transcriptional regulator